MSTKLDPSLWSFDDLYKHVTTINDLINGVLKEKLNKIKFNEQKEDYPEWQRKKDAKERDLIKHILHAQKCFDLLKAKYDDDIELYQKFAQDFKRDAEYYQILFEQGLKDFNYHNENATKALKESGFFENSDKRLSKLNKGK